MIQLELFDNDGLLNCTTCINEIPHSEAFSPEAVDYVLYYCGIECYELWERDREAGRGPPSEGVQSDPHGP